MTKTKAKAVKRDHLKELHDEVAAMENSTSNGEQRHAYREVMAKIKEHQAK